MRLRWSAANRCRADAEVTGLLSKPERNSPQSKQTSFVSQQHWTTHYSTQMQPRPWNKASLPCGTVPLYCHCPLLHCCSWMSLVVISHDGIFNCGHVSTKVSDDNWYLHKTPLRSKLRTHTWARMQQDRTTKLEGWNSQCMSSLRSAFPVRTAIGRWEGAMVSILTSDYLSVLKAKACFQMCTAFQTQRPSL